MDARDLLRRERRRLALDTAMVFLFAAFVLIGGFLAMEEHRAHALGLVPYLLVVIALFLALLGYGKPKRRKGGVR